MEYVDLVNRLLSALVVFSHIAIVTLGVALLYSYYIRPIQFLKNLFEELGKRAFVIGFILSALAVLGSLFYSEIAKYPPCALCWYQRIFVFSQPVIFMVGYLRKDIHVLYSIGALSLVGSLISLYHYTLQMVTFTSLPCPATGGVSCTVREFVEFGYVTIPLMGLTFFTIMMFLTYSHHMNKKSMSV